MTVENGIIGECDTADSFISHISQQGNGNRLTSLICRGDRVLKRYVVGGRLTDGESRLHQNVVAGSTVDCLVCDSVVCRNERCSQLSIVGEDHIAGRRGYFFYGVIEVVIRTTLTNDLRTREGNCRIVALSSLTKANGISSQQYIGHTALDLNVTRQRKGSCGLLEIHAVFCTCVGLIGVNADLRTVRQCNICVSRCDQQSGGISCFGMIRRCYGRIFDVDSGAAISTQADGIVRIKDRGVRELEGIRRFIHVNAVIAATDDHRFVLNDDLTVGRTAVCS